MIDQFLNQDISTLNWVLFLCCGVLIGMSKTGLSGAGLMVVPIMAGIFGGKASVGILLPMLIVADIFAVIYYNRHANWRYVFMAMPWAIAGVIVATIFGKNINDNQFKIVLSIVILSGIGMMIWQDFRSKKLSVPDNWWFAGILGLLGGFTTMVGNAAGPVMTLYLLSMRLTKNNYIGTAAWFFFIINMIKVPFHVYSWGTITSQTLITNIFVFPAIVIGAIFGIKIVKIFPEKAYRIFLFATTIISALFLL